MLCSQGLSLNQLNCVFHDLTVFLISHALPGWGVFHFFLLQASTLKLTLF